jgi:TfoX/Sxy family transcriptional regulator of competence genes
VDGDFLLVLNEVLTRRVRELLAGASRVEEKRMFGGVAFMVNGKMCVTVNGPRIMCRVDPARMDELTRKPGCQVMMMRGREFPGYVRVDEEALRTRKDLDYWVGLALEFNSRAKASPKRKK